MKVDNASSNIASETYKNNFETSKVSENEKVQEKGKNVYAGNLNLPGDYIAEKKAKAGRDAIRTLIEQFANDIEKDEFMDKLRSTRDEIEAEISEYNDNIKNLEGKLDRLAKDYNVEPESQEAKELELRHKLQKGEKLTEEESEMASTLGEVSEYQKYALDYYKQIDYFEGKIEGINRIVEQCNKSLTRMSINRLKDNGMLKAREEADNIIMSANDEILQIVVDNAIDNIDEKQEEAEEKLDKIEEEDKTEKEEQEKEKLEKEVKKEIESAKRKQKSLLLSSIGYIADVFDNDEIYNAVMENVKKISEINTLTEEDIKGLLADLEL